MFPPSRTHHLRVAPVALLLALFLILGPVQASVCVDNVGGTVTVDASNVPPSCTYGVLLDAGEYQALTSSPTLADIFAMPTAQDLGQMWAIGFSLPLIVYLSAWALGVVVNFINRN